MYSPLPTSVYHLPFRFRPMWQVVQAHFHPPALGGRLHFQPRWSTASESMYIERDFADMNCMFSCATCSPLTPSLQEDYPHNVPSQNMALPSDPQQRIHFWFTFKIGRL
jgi:hypothetical protein